jgi:GxxExxY protein
MAVWDADERGKGGLNKTESDVLVLKSACICVNLRPINRRFGQMDDEKERTEYKHKDLSEKIIMAFYNVYNTLGYGFLEKVYENAMMIELEKLGSSAKAQWPIQVYYEGKLVGEYFTDILVEERINVELKAVKNLSLEHEAQLLNYLKATKIEVGLLLNFGPKPEVKRKAFDNSRK